MAMEGTLTSSHFEDFTLFSEMCVNLFQKQQQKTDITESNIILGAMNDHL